MSDGSEQNKDTTQGENTQRQTTQASDGIPDGLPESFWDAENGQIKTDELVGSYKELNEFKSQYDERLSKRPESADKYELRVPESVEIPEGVEWQFDENSPLLEKARELVFNAGGDQSVFDGLVGQYITESIEKSTGQATQAEETYQAEMAALGENGKARIDAVNSYLTSALPKEKAEALQAGITSKAALEALEDLISKGKDAGLQSPGQGSQPTGMTQEQLDAMQNDPKYWRDKDPEIVRKVQEGYQKLYPGKQTRIT